MKINLLLFLLTSFFFSCKNENGTDNMEKKEIQMSSNQLSDDPLKKKETIYSDTILLPLGFNELRRTQGDLNNDGLDELVVIAEDENAGEWGFERDLFVYTKENNQWLLWDRFNGPILSSEEGGVFGDPFESISVERNCIVISHFGGSNWKWAYTHRYRFQNDDWYLIGASSEDGKPCEFWNSYDYNLSTGKINVKLEIQNCDEDEETSEVDEMTFEHSMKLLPTMKKMKVGETNVVLSDSISFSF